MIVKYNERLLKYFRAFFADIFNQKRKKMHYLQTEGLIGRDLLRDIRSAICIEFLVKIARTLFKLDCQIQRLPL